MSSIPGISKKLQDALGRAMVIEVMGKVDYSMKEVCGKECEKVIHIYSAKGYVEREGEVFLLIIVAEDRELKESNVKLSGIVGDEDKGKLDRVLQEFSDLMD